MDDQLDDSQYEAMGLKVLASVRGSSVVILEKLWKDFTKFPREDQRTLLRWMRIWCTGEHHIPPEKFKILDKISGYRIDEFKSYQCRAYGTVATIGSDEAFVVTAFVVTALDVKKKDLANPAVLKRAARIALELKLEPKR